MDIRLTNTLSPLPWGTATKSPKTMGSQRRMTFLCMLHCAADTLCYFWVCTPVSTCVNGRVSTVCRCVHMSGCNYGVGECCFPRLNSRAKQQLLLTTDYDLPCCQFTQKTNRGHEGIKVETQKWQWCEEQTFLAMTCGAMGTVKSSLSSCQFYIKREKKMKEYIKIIPKRLGCCSQYQILTQYEVGTETAGRISTMTSIS